MRAPRNHHFIAQGYLRRFAVGANEQVYVFDRETGRNFRASVRNVAAQRDFNRIEAEGLDPNDLEVAYGQFETDCAAALKRLDELGEFANETDREIILTFIAGLITRHPRRRNSTEEFIGDVMRQSARALLTNEAMWGRFLDDTRRSGAELPTVTREELLEFVNSDDTTIGLDQTFQITLELSNLEPILFTLRQRKWSVFRCAGEAEFVTSDDPVSLLDSSSSAGEMPIGHGMSETVVLFPVGRRTLLHGSYEGEERYLQLVDHQIAQINGITAVHCHRQIFSALPTFTYSLRGVQRNSDGLFDEPFFSPSQGRRGDPT